MQTAAAPASSAPASSSFAPAAASSARPSAPFSQAASSAPAAAGSGAPGTADYQLWKQIVDAVRSASPRHGKSLAFGRLIRIVPGEVVIAFTSDADFHRTTVSGAGKATIEAVMSQLTGQPTRLVIDLNAARTAPPSIAEEEAKERAARERSVDFRVRHHPALQAVMRILGGELEHIQVLERERPTVEEPEPSDDSN